MMVTPETSLAHLGGIKYGKGYEQFEATAWSKGPDGKTGTDDDFPIMPVDDDWAMKAFPKVTYDNDIKFVGQRDKDGFFPPNVEQSHQESRFIRTHYETMKSDKNET